MAARHETISVMYVDDDPWQLEATKLLFDVEKDIQVNWCSSPDEALKRFDQVDCVVTDHFMRRMSGIDLARNIRSQSNIPIIVYSIFDEPGIADAARTAGANSFIVNDPVHGSHRLLTLEIRRLVNEHRIH